MVWRRVGSLDLAGMLEALCPSASSKHEAVAAVMIVAGSHTLHRDLAQPRRESLPTNRRPVPIYHSKDCDKAAAFARLFTVPAMASESPAVELGRLCRTSTMW